MVCKPAKLLGLCVGLVLIIALLGIDVFLVHTMIAQPVDLNLYLTALLFALTLPLLAFWAYAYYGLASLQYHIDRNGLVISCGGVHHTVPMEAIRRIIPGREVTVSRDFRGIGWPGYLTGRIRLRGLGWIITRSTEPVERQIIVATDTMAYGISPKDPEQFLEDLAVRRSLDPVRRLEESTRRASLASWPVWHDIWFWLALLLPFLACAVLFGLVVGYYDTLPGRIAIHFDASGQVDRIAPKSRLLLVPAIAGLASLANGLLGLSLHNRERMASYLLLLATWVVNAVIWLAVLDILVR